MPLSEIDIAVFNFIKDFIAKNKYSPSIREIVDNTKISSTSMVKYSVHRLSDEGLLEVTPKIARSFVIKGKLKKKD